MTARPSQLSSAQPDWRIIVDIPAFGPVEEIVAKLRPLNHLFSLVVSAMTQLEKRKEKQQVE